ncbi:sugar phosphate isomerase/epimerase family protein [Salinarimonas ramus]|uniref:Xylose isomerase n=1 Tax=Salinarimonas ramus TaxID=690164 RepID=A0A917V4T0_9HYPH|nr:sugar phosphate isomerase/epimerase [Salinarimonas ramus]GGK39789.1 xylose isomerase [Salinarimonas ramus]
MSATLSIQLYSLREHGTLLDRLDVVRDAGFRHVEAVASLLDEPAAFRDALDARGLSAPSTHVPLAALRERLDETARAAKTIGIAHLAVPALHASDRPSDADGWRAIGAELGLHAKRLAGEGLSLAFHNHHWEVEPLPDGALPLDLLLDAGAADGLLWQADVAWLVRGGDDPAARLARHAGRLASVHVKDIARAGEAEDEDGWADVGHGVLDWADLWRRSREAGANLMIAEHDKPSDAARFATRSFAAMRRLAEGETR